MRIQDKYTSTTLKAREPTREGNKVELTDNNYALLEVLQKIADAIRRKK